MDKGDAISHGQCQSASTYKLLWTSVRKTDTLSINTTNCDVQIHVMLSYAAGKANDK